MCTVEFKFEPRQFVLITVHGLNYSARIVGCKFSTYNTYDCDYIADGEFKTGSFYEDEISAS